MQSWVHSWDCFYCCNFYLLYIFVSFFRVVFFFFGNLGYIGCCLKNYLALIFTLNWHFLWNPSVPKTKTKRKTTTETATRLRDIRASGFPDCVGFSTVHSAQLPALTLALKIAGKINLMSKTCNKLQRHKARAISKRISFIGPVIYFVQIYFNN